MDIERLKEVKQQIKGVHYGINGADLHLLYDLLPLVDEAIARQSETEMAVCPDCGGSGVYQEYDDEFDRYHVYTCYKCEGTGEIARQSVKREEVQAYDQLLEKTE